MVCRARRNKKEQSSLLPRRGQLSPSEMIEENYARRKAQGAVLNLHNLPMLEERRDIFYLLSLILHNTKPVGHQVSLLIIVTCEL